jgi:hypothetical protein
MDALPVHLFRSSFGPFLEPLNEHELRYDMRQVRSVVPMASGSSLEIIKVIGDAAFWPAVAAVVIAFINGRNGRKVIITTNNKMIVHAEGLSLRELERVLQIAENMTAIDPNTPKGDGSGTRKA